MSAFQIAVLFVMLLLAIHILMRTGLTFDAAIKKLEGDPEWQKFLGSGKIEDLAR